MIDTPDGAVASWPLATSRTQPRVEFAAPEKCAAPVLHERDATGGHEAIDPRLRATQILGRLPHRQPPVGLGSLAKRGASRSASVSSASSSRASSRTWTNVAFMVRPTSYVYAPRRCVTLDSGSGIGSVDIGPGTTVILDEAGMVDHKRLDALTELVERSGAKLIAVGDGKQLPSIGPGGMFDRLTGRAPTVELETIHRTTDPKEQRAWQALRAGEPERAMAHYKAQGRLHLADTRDQAAESAVQAWAQLTREVGIDKVALIADSSNKEIDRLNARAQHLRAQRGELGPDELPLSNVYYGLRQGDRVAFIAQHRPHGQPRIENGTRGQVTNIDQDGTLTLTLDGSDRRLQLARQDAESLRLAYAQHVYRQQGATVDRAVVLTGGWQTSKETTYVQATRARHGTDWYLARDQLGEDPDRITRLAREMSRSRVRRPSVAYQEAPDPWDPSRDPLRLSRLSPHLGQLLRTPEPDAPEYDIERGR